MREGGGWRGQSLECAFVRLLIIKGFNRCEDVCPTVSVVCCDVMTSFTIPDLMCSEFRVPTQCAML